MKLLICHECSGEIRRAMRAKGIDAYSCDLKLSEDTSRFHIIDDCLNQIGSPEWDAFGFHPDCTFTTVNGIHWNNRGRGWGRTEAAIRHIEEIRAKAGNRPFYLEQPVSIVSTRWRKPDQIVQPHDFGEDASKKTCLWLQGLPKLVTDPAKRFAGRWVEYPPGSGKMVERWSNQTDSGQNRLGPSPTRKADRSRTYPGIARAMADQWAAILLK
jgi:hypothetical protein